jgi:hypothetical protein
MEITQKKFSNRAKFEFGEESLKYTVKDKSGSHSFTIDYGSIPTDYGEVEERNLWYRNVGYLWILLGIFFTVYTQKVSIWIFIGFVCMAVYWLVKTTYTVIDTEKGRLFVIKNHLHDNLMKEIDTRRKKQWYAWYGEVDFGNEPAKELNKFKWLLDNKVISEMEYNENVNKVISFHKLELVDREDSNSEETIN